MPRLLTRCTAEAHKVHSRPRRKRGLRCFLCRLRCKARWTRRLQNELRVRLQNELRVQSRQSSQLLLPRNALSPVMAWAAKVPISPVGARARVGASGSSSMDKNYQKVSNPCRC